MSARQISKMVVTVHFDDGSFMDLLTPDAAIVEAKYALTYGVQETFYAGRAIDLEHDGTFSLSLNASGVFKKEK